MGRPAQGAAGRGPYHPGGVFPLGPGRGGCGVHGRQRGAGHLSSRLLPRCGAVQWRRVDKPVLVAGGLGGRPASVSGQMAGGHPGVAG